MGRVLRFALVAGLSLFMLPLVACHEEFDAPGKPDLAKAPLNFGFDLAGADLSGAETEQDLSVFMHPDLSKTEGDGGN